MQNNIAGPGLGLPLPQLLYPANLVGGEVNVSTNNIALAPGEAIPIPAGTWMLQLGKYCSYQYLDPVTGIWTLVRSNDNQVGSKEIQSDGYNVRVANLTGCPVAAVVTNGGSGYVQASTTVTPSAGNSTWQALVGGAISTVTTITTVTNAGSGYGIAPIVFIDAPPSPGVQATAVATISSGTVSALTVTNQGAGYLTAPNVTFMTNPSDPNLGSVKPATAVTALTASGTITAVLCTNNGAPVANTTSLTVAGSGTSAVVTPVFLQVVTGVSIVSGGGGYGTFTQLTTVGGFNTNVPALTNPTISLTGFTPRPAVASLALTGTAITSLNTIYDGGLFLASPGPVPVTNGIVSTVASITLTLGSANDSIRLQQI